MRRLIIYVMIALLIFPLFNIKAQEVIKLAVFMDKTGKTKDVSRFCWMGIEDYFGYINEKGGINGKKIELLMRDTKYQVPLAIKHYEEVRTKGIVGIAGWGTGTSQALKPHVNRDKIPWLPGSMAESLVSPIMPYNFIIAPSYKDQFLTLLKYAASHPKDPLRPVRVAFIFNSTAFGRAPIKPAEKLAKELGIEVVGKEVVELDATDADEQIARLLPKKPDYIIIQETGPATVAILKSCKKLGLKTTVMGAFYSGDESIIEKAEDALKDVELIVASPFSRWYEEDVPGIEAIKEYSQRHRPDMKEWPMYYIEGWVIGMVFAEAIKMCGDVVTSEKVRDAIESLKNFDTGGLTDLISYSPTDHKGAEGIKLFKANVETKRFDRISGWIK